MTTIKQLVENKQKLDYQVLCTSLIHQFGVTENINWNSVLPAPQQQELFGGEVLRLFDNHPEFSKQKDIRPICLKKGEISQMLFFFTTLSDRSLPKKQIEQITKRFIKGADANRYIIWFFGNSDSTELKVVLSSREGKKIVQKTLPFGVNQPYFKTYDFILSEVQSKVQGLFVEPTELWKALWNAFDISIVNRKFYDEIKSAFDLLLKQTNIKGNPFEKDEDRVQFAIRLIGRIIFCWFLKRKSILRDDVLSSQAVHLVGKKNYYHDLLEPLFFEVMNRPQTKRQAGLPKIIAHYPFLNGGLFDAQANDFYKESPNYKLQIENGWFLDFFSNTLEKYNFTVDENSSSNAEIAIDPEMLGRIFENLLAEQNPETGESARKSTGSFYTPREVVDYMVEQSIAEYLKTKIGNTSVDESLEEFVHTNHFPDGLKPSVERISEALSDIKILDPACGSGAFPIGVLQKLLALKHELWQYQNPKKQLTQAEAYKQKLSTIQNSIYGVDIQPMAVELSRLRCWLSLVVDEEVENIKPLPNLDFKFVCANTLIDVPEDEYVKNQSEAGLKNFTTATKKYFDTDYANKKELKTEIQHSLAEIIEAHDKAINQIVGRLKKERNSATASRLKKLEKDLLGYTKQQSTWHSYKNIFENKKVDFFNRLYFFPTAKDGFDLIIGNPPYVQIQKLQEVVKDEIEDQKFDTYVRTGDLYQIFYEAGVRNLKRNGFLCFITSNKWMRADYGEVTRRYFSENTQILSVVDFGMAQMFESATTYTSIVLLKKAEPNTSISLCRIENDYKLDVPLYEYVNSRSVEVINPGSNSWITYKKEHFELIKRIAKQGVPLKDWRVTINRGIVTGYNEAFIVDSAKRDELIKSDPNCKDLFKPILRGEDIKAYFPDWTGRWLLFIPWHFPLHNDPSITGASKKAEEALKKEYPSVYEHLLSFKRQLSARNKTETGVRYEWYCLQRWGSNYHEDFSKPKIIYPNMTKYLPFVYDKGSFFTNQKCFIITGEKLGYLTAFLNSKIFRFTFKEYFPELLGDTRELSKVFFETVAIKNVDDETNSQFEKIVDSIQALKKSDGDTSKLEGEIEERLTKIYGLTESEKDIINEANP